MGGISITQLLIIAVIVVLLFGTKTAHAGLRSRRLDQGLQEGDRRRHAVDPNTAEKSSLDDADFSAKPITDKQPEVKPEESKNKEQV